MTHINDRKTMTTGLMGNLSKSDKLQFSYKDKFKGDSVMKTN